MAVGHDTELIRELERLRIALATGERESRELQREVADLRQTLMRERTAAKELRRSYATTVRALSNAVEARAGYTGRHAERATAYALEIVRALGISLHGQIEFGFLLHDIGKVAIPDAILFKPGPLTDEEQALMRQHPLLGAQIVQAIDFPGGAADVVRSHHERWDGKGYPDGLIGEHIPVAARIFAVADAFDAMTTKRPYRAASSFDAARKIITGQAGAQFDPRVVHAFNSISDARFERIRAQIQ